MGRIPVVFGDPPKGRHPMVHDLATIMKAIAVVVEDPSEGRPWDETWPDKFLHNGKKLRPGGSLWWTIYCRSDTIWYWVFYQPEGYLYW